MAAELGIEPPDDETVEVSLRDAADKEMVRMRVGAAFADGPGNYVQRLDGDGSPIYLSSSTLSLSTDLGSFLDKEILGRDQSEVKRIEGDGFELEKAEGSSDFELSGSGSVKLKNSEVNRLKGLVSGLRFEEVYLSDDPQVANLDFSPAVTIELEDGSGYVFSTNSGEDGTFVRVQGFHTVTQVAITRDESEEELAAKADVLTRADEIEAFNQFHGSWTYELGEWAGESLQLKRADLIDSDSS